MLLRGLLCFVLLVSPAVAQTLLDTAAIDRGFGRTGQTMPGSVYRLAIPRTDLRVTIGSLTVLPGFALGGYAAFVAQPQGTLAVGDLVLLEPEIAPVMGSLKASGFEITALHNHLRGEHPHVMYMHFMGSGDAGTLAAQLHTALAKSATPLGPLAPAVPKSLSFQATIESVLNLRGRVNGAILSFSVPRAEAISVNGIVIPPAAGVATAINFQAAGGENVATTGDFVLLGNEVTPVEQTLLANGIAVTALHHHMIDDSPHLYYMHFWAVGPPAQVAAGLHQALVQIK